MRKINGFFITIMLSYIDMIRRSTVALARLNCTEHALKCSASNPVRRTIMRAQSSDPHGVPALTAYNSGTVG